MRSKKKNIYKNVKILRTFLQLRGRTEEWRKQQSHLLCYDIVETGNMWHNGQYFTSQSNYLKIDKFVIL